VGFESRPPLVRDVRNGRLPLGLRTPAWIGPGQALGELVEFDGAAKMGKHNINISK
jgi:hypothetical protein